MTVRPAGSRPRAALHGKQTDAFARDYWREVLSATGAKLVIPIQWDDFMRPLDEPLQPMPYPLNDFDAGMRLLLKLAEADGLTVRFIPLFEAFEVIQSRR